MYPIGKAILIKFCIFLLIPFSVRAEISHSSNPVAQNRTPNMEVESVSDCDADHPQAKGVILFFKSWPLNEQEEALLIKKMEKMGLERIKDNERFKARVYEWSEWQDGVKALDVCKKLSDLSFLDNCEPEYFLCPGTEAIQ